MKTYPSNLIADFFLDRAAQDEDTLTNLKVQKLCYYAAGLIAAVRGKGGAPLFREQIEAWQHGPVVPEQYKRFSNHGSAPIPAPDAFDTSQFADPDLAILNDVYAYYGQYSAWKLRSMTHEESPWISARTREDKIISQDELLTFFANEVSQEYVASYAAAQ
jgi:uncharacterized phage-associated protein